LSWFQVSYYATAFDVLDMTDSLVLEPGSIKFALASIYLTADEETCQKIMQESINQGTEHSSTVEAFDMDNFIRGMENDTLLLSLPNDATGSAGSGAAGGNRDMKNVKVKSNKMVV
jgi:hypothetical protein